MSIKSCILKSLEDVYVKIEKNLDENIKMEEIDKQQLHEMFVKEIEDKLLNLVKNYNDLCEYRYNCLLNILSLKDRIVDVPERITNLVTLKPAGYLTSMILCINPL